MMALQPFAIQRRWHQLHATVMVFLSQMAVAIADFASSTHFAATSFLSIESASVVIGVIPLNTAACCVCLQAHVVFMVKKCEGTEANWRSQSHVKSLDVLNLLHFASARL